jgi:hypothetical protein
MMPQYEVFAQGTRRQGIAVVALTESEYDGVFHNHSSPY